VAFETTAAATEKPTRNSVLLNLLPHILETLKREPALAITLCYLLVAMAGIFYNYSFYEKFGIPVLTLSQISDFLVAGIQQPMALFLVLTTFPVCWLVDKVNSRRRSRYVERLSDGRESRRNSLWARMQDQRMRWHLSQTWLVQLGYVVVIVGYGWTFVSIYANHRADAVRRGDAPKVTIWLNGDAAGLPTKAGQTWTYLGAVANYVFVYDPAAGRSVVLPVNNIARIEPLAQANSLASPSIIVAPIP